MKQQRFLILGAGTWGSALAIYLATLKHQVVLWGHNPEHVQALAAQRVHPHLAQVVFPPQLQLQSDLAKAFEQAGDEAIVFIVVPSFAFVEMIEKIKPFISSTTRLLWGTKGLKEDGAFFDQMLQPYTQVAVLAGPSFAYEVARALPTAVTIATRNPGFGELLVNAFHSDFFRVYLSNDLVGVQLGGAVKNVLAIAVGMSDGLGFGANARAALITRGLAELCRLGKKLGAQLATLTGLSGVGDIILTCTDNQSRNRRFGLALGKGSTLDQAQKEIKQVIEGKINVKQIMAVAQRNQIEMPICQQVHAVLYEAKAAQQAVIDLLKREPKCE